MQKDVAGKDFEEEKERRKSQRPEEIWQRILQRFWFIEG
jgi:hypothetical protein